MDTLVLMDVGDLDAHARMQVIAWRGRRGWTQGQLAERLLKFLPPDRHTWASQPNISRYENGAAVDLTTLFAIARTLGVPFMTLLGPLPQDAQRVASALDQPLVRGFVEALDTGKLDPNSVRIVVSTLRQLAGLPPLAETSAPTNESED